jgi:hypothetical protein
MSKAQRDQHQKGYREERVAELVNQELTQSVLSAMRQIRLRHREVLALRCYEHKGYDQIANAMECSELGARLLFYRAKKSLARQLARNGLGRGSLLLALVIVGKLSAPSKAAAAGVTIAAGTMRIGTAAKLIGAVTSAKGIAVVTTATALTVSSVAVVPKILPDHHAGRSAIVVSSQVSELAAASAGGIEQCSYFFPEGANGPVMIRQMRHSAGNNRTYRRRLQNDNANYVIDGGTVFIENCRMWAEDLSVPRLPTDTPELRRFISRMEGKSPQTNYVPCRDKSKNLLVTARRDEENNSEILEAVRQYNVGEEELFLYDWQKGAKMVDNRDIMHKRGWTYFAITGQINGKAVSGHGRIPFVYRTSEFDYPWIRLKIGSEFEIVDSLDRACVYGPEGKRQATYPGGTFLKGLARPWMGLHTIDIIRRDAAENAIRFETRYISQGRKTEVTLLRANTALIYTIDMENDVIEKMTFVRDSEKNKHTSEASTIQFSYLQDIDQAGSDFATPESWEYSDLSKPAHKLLWLFDLAEETLVK